MSFARDSRRIAEYFRHYGIADICLRVLHRLRIISVKHTFAGYIYELEEKFKETAAGSAMRAEAVEIREIKSEELPRLKFADGTWDRDTIANHFREGYRFFAATLNDTVVSVNGLQTEFAFLTYIKRPLVRLPRGFAYLNHAVTAPRFRKRGIGTRLREYMLGILQQEGFKTACLVSFLDNRDACRWQTKSGFQCWGTITYIRRGRREFWLKNLTKTGRKYPWLFDAQAGRSGLQLQESYV